MHSVHFIAWIVRQSRNLRIYAIDRKTFFKIKMLITESFDQLGNTSIIIFSNKKIIFEFENLSDANINGITGFKNHEIDDFKHLFDSTTLKVFMGILFLIVETFKNFEVLLFIDVGIHQHQL